MDQEGCIGFKTADRVMLGVLVLDVVPLFGLHDEHEVQRGVCQWACSLQNNIVDVLHGLVIFGHGLLVTKLALVVASVRSEVGDGLVKGLLGNRFDWKLLFIFFRGIVRCLVNFKHKVYDCGVRHFRLWLFCI